MESDGWDDRKWCLSKNQSVLDLEYDVSCFDCFPSTFHAVPSCSSSIGRFRKHSIEFGG